MENRNSKRNVALLEKCVMSSVGIQSLFHTMPNSPYQLHIFSTQTAFKKAMLTTSFSTVIFSLSTIRKERRVGLAFLTEMATDWPRMRRLVIADDDVEARLINSLSPSHLDGVLSKTTPLEALQEELFSALSNTRRVTESSDNLWFLNLNRILSPTEREILRFMSNGYSMPQIAVQLERNIKTIRAHKFNVMSKLGVSNDAGLLDAADILLYMRGGEPLPALHSV
ncbi:bgl operon transcriptional regulator BglJ [Citrobacter amalonaticus]|uniref:Bgl operon transcriptional regulator BglJ n=1 Tax=Citrobacter amalonaticus TaxID=35703 RepID=A0A2S4RXI3_CITAM|nr:DNA-binding transcriptional activator BglJ [Citrobacter amalonaticus]POT56083.1 bgl operon transcriptional regulator BglJ [Citrobacter amalonaticus]POT74392.1 bgl operon transcriptional regulator BglJ [Citrobacter amalonaticus]POU65192.1 bgl operon transcriptional regulator BglJ [Citrobacter amalonaticus]POV04026.1 bgl operon transcriptional regulator BglJ [Citrobacter amalonaticus]